MPTSIVSYNVNGIRAAINKRFYEWLADNHFDVVCLQETKATFDQVDLAPLEALGYRHHWFSAEKKGYSGVATFSKIQPDYVAQGCGIGKYDCEGRIIRTDFGDWTLLNCYFPSGTSGELRQQVKYDFLEDIYLWVNELRKERPKLIVVGDYNIAHREIDIHDPKGNKKTSGFLPEERAWMDKWFAAGFCDAFRCVHPEKVEYSWWSQRFQSRAKNKGWRIDYQSVTENLKNKVLDVRHLGDVVHSDHCAVWMEIDL